MLRIGDSASTTSMLGALASRVTAARSRAVS